MNPDMTVDELKALVRTVPDFPHAGIMFRDITTLIGHPQGMAASVKHLARLAKAAGAQKIAGMEARGFIFGAAVAVELGVGFVPVRKPGKLPIETIGVEYELEYGTDTLEMHIDGIEPGQNVLVVDDLLATGGTVEACCRMIEQSEANIVACVFLIELAFLNGAERLTPHDIQSLIRYD